MLFYFYNMTTVSLPYLALLTVAFSFDPILSLQRNGRNQYLWCLPFLYASVVTAVKSHCGVSRSCEQMSHYRLPGD